MSERQLDVAVARVLGCDVKPHKWGFECGCKCGTHNEDLGTGSQFHLKDYSTDPSYVGEMLEWAASQGLKIDLCNHIVSEEGEWRALIWSDRCNPSGYGGTPQLALARAITEIGTS